MTVINCLDYPKKQTNHRRRQFLKAAAVSCLTPFIPGCSRQQIAIKSIPKLHFLSAGTREESLYSVSGIDSGGQNTFSIPTGLRCHSGAFHPVDNNIAVVFARRPGMQLLIVDTLQGRMLSSIECPQDRHFYGHGCFSHDGNYLYTTENDYQKGVGIIGIWDANNYSRLGEMQSYGIGPHDIHLLSDGQTLVLANGGIRTHPDYMRRKLNLDSMESALVYLNAAQGTFLKRITVENKHLSIRHLALTDDDKVAIAMQYQGPKNQIVPLIGIQQKEGTIEMMATPRNELRQMRQYTASICIHPQTGILGVTCPRGNIVTFWQLAGQQWIKTLAIADAGGIGLDHDKKYFVITTGTGEVFQVNPVNFEQRLLYVDPTIKWDNHMIVSNT